MRAWVLGIVPVVGACAAPPAAHIEAPVQSVTIPAVASAQAPPVCPDGATWETERRACVLYESVQHRPMPPLDLSHMPDPCGLGGSPNDPGLDACDPDQKDPHP
jgi:hypothetical protein